MGVLLTAAAIAAAVAVGVWAERRWPLGAGRAARQALLLILYVLLPPIVFFNLAASDIDVDHGVGLALGIVAVSLASLLSWYVASRVLKLSRPAVGAVVCAVLSVNTGYLGYPLTVALLGRDQLSTAVLYDVLVTGPCLLLGAFAVGAAFGTKAGEGPHERVRAFFTRNPPLYAAIAGLLAPQALAPDSSSTSPRRSSSQSCRSASSPSAPPWPRTPSTASCRCPRPLTRPVAVALAARLALAPALLMLLAAPLIDLPAAYRLLAAMPSGLNSMVVAHAYGLDMEITAEAVTWSTGIVVLAALGSLLI